MKYTQALQSQHHKRDGSRDAVSAFTEATRQSVPVAVPSSSMHSHEAEHEGQVAQFRHTLDRFSIHPPVADEGRLTQFKLPSKDPVIQRQVLLQGNFAIQGDVARNALDVVMQSLSRNAASALETYKRDNLTILRFETVTPIQGGADVGATGFRAEIDGVWWSLDQICDPKSPYYHFGARLNRDTQISVTIMVDPTLHNVPPENEHLAATLAHEITVHALHTEPWLRKLRSGAYTGKQMRAAWWTATQDGGLLNYDGEHETFARGGNRTYNQTVQNIHANLPAAEQADFLASVQADIDDHLPSGASTPN